MSRLLCTRLLFLLTLLPIRLNSLLRRVSNSFFYPCSAPPKSIFMYNYLIFV